MEAKATEKIYEIDVYCKEFSAIVIDCKINKKGKYEITLDRTAFFPEGGGQLGDIGVLKSANKTVNIIDTHERNENVIHIADGSLEIGEKVTGFIDWQFRFDMMQNHTGEHIISGLIHNKYNYNNVGFHMGKDCITLDLDGDISLEELSQFELLANKAIWDNLPVTTTVYNQDEIYKTKNIDYRSKKELAGNIRIVRIGDIDTCACCGTHVTRTGEIGLIKLVSMQKFKSGVRIEMLSGRRALEYVNKIVEENHKTSVLLSAKPLKTFASVERLKKDNDANLYRIVGLENDAFKRYADELTNAGDVLIFENNLNADSLRKLSIAILEKCGGRCAVFSGDDLNGYKYAIGDNNADLRPFVKSMNASLNGRGGGKPNFVQGSVAVNKSEIQKYFDALNF